ncbi:hypothetical protein QR680_010846 [Steinernema hermaphroditum]|uniref:Uncharacterized protein n=1 Tax=Steinernema hermaphroditum TaxID=289476 RepID=A0AA39MBV3_9BILA|nr:hypothetical protein QR680_010846 [Steinernema hermaphroditum]
MNTLSPDFWDRVYHLLRESTIRAADKKLSRRLWSPCARYHLKKRANHAVRLPIPVKRHVSDSDDESDPETNEEILEKVKKNSYFRITHITLGLDLQPEELLDSALPYIAFDDDSSLDIYNLPRPTYARILEKIWSAECLFTCLNLRYVSEVSKKILLRHKEKKILKRVVLRDGWRASEMEWIEDLLHQKQLTFFRSDWATEILFDKPQIEKLISAVFEQK